MRKTLSLLYRMLLIAGVLVALTPCGLCQKSQMTVNFKSYCSSAKAVHNCCHSKSRGPLCQIMDQSSTAVSPAALDVPAIQAAPVVFHVVTLVKRVEASAFLTSSCSSPPGLLPLRI